MHRLNVIHYGEVIGTLAAPDSLRPPMSAEEIADFPVALFWWSRSPIYDMRDGDLRVELRGEGPAEELVIIASDGLGPGDVACLVGFMPAEGADIYAVDGAAMSFDDALKYAHARKRPS